MLLQITPKTAFNLLGTGDKRDEESYLDVSRSHAGRVKTASTLHIPAAQSLPPTLTHLMDQLAAEWAD